MRPFHRISMLLAGLAVAGCGGGGASVAPTRPSAGIAKAANVTLTIAYLRVASPAARRSRHFIDASNTANLTFQVKSGTATVGAIQTLTPTCTATTCTASAAVALVAGTYEFIIKALDANQYVLSLAGESVAVANGPTSLTIELTGQPNVLNLNNLPPNATSMSATLGGANVGLLDTPLNGTIAGASLIGPTVAAATATLGFAFVDADNVPIAGSQSFPSAFLASYGPIEVRLDQYESPVRASLSVPTGSTATCASATSCTLAASSDTLAFAYAPAADAYANAVPLDAVVTLTATERNNPGGTPIRLAQLELRTFCTAATSACLHVRPQAFRSISSPQILAPTIAVGGGHVWMGGSNPAAVVFDTTAEGNPTVADTAYHIYYAPNGFINTETPGLFSYSNGQAYGPDIALVGFNGPELVGYDTNFGHATVQSYTPASSRPSFASKNGEGANAIDGAGVDYFVDPQSYALFAYDPGSATFTECSLSNASGQLAGSLVAVDRANDRLWFTAVDGSGKAYAGYVNKGAFSATACNANLAALATMTGAPSGLTVDGIGNAWYDDGARLGELTVTSTGAIANATAALPASFLGGYGVAFDASDRMLYFTDASGVLGRASPGSGVASAAAGALALALPQAIATEIAMQHPLSSGPNASNGFVGLQMGAPVPDENGVLWFAIGDASSSLLNAGLDPNVVASPDHSFAFSLDPRAYASKFAAGVPATLRRLRR